ncbi:MAG TPA: methyltransferase domain-containing protein [Candidatus Polarisedimenticolaceae bacterium]|nr:methyltransferase domain-containing protein [Candidatus Polarisedimenticolaceae bacterium]
MDLADYYRRQFAWRSWGLAFEALPELRGKTVLDLGCGVGDQAAELVARGARVIGLDISEEVLEAARSRQLAGAEFRRADLRAALDLDTEVDGIWSSFAAAYFPDLATVLVQWIQPLHSGGWIALTEIDDFFGHEPLEARTHELLEAYAREALAAGRYDFRMGGKLRANLERCGLRVTRELTLPDLELAFDGPALPEVLAAWRARLEGMTLLRQSCAAEFARVRDEFLGCLARADHRARATVRCCIAVAAPSVKTGSL